MTPLARRRQWPPDDVSARQQTSSASGAGGPARRIFIVGCPRSGTTLLQSLLHSHPEIVSFPETFFFAHLFSGEGAGARLGLAPRAAEHAWARLRASIDGIPSKPRALTVSGYIRHFVDALDRAARDAGTTTWVEKTPMHLHYTDQIAQYVQGAWFIHIIRSGAPVVASLYDVTQKHPERWGGSRSVEACVARWKADAKRSARCADRCRHAFVSYEQLSGQTEPTLLALLRVLGLRRSSEEIGQMLRSYGSGTASLVRDEPWKEGVGGEIADRGDHRAAAILGPKECARVVAAVRPEEDLLRTLPYVR